MNDDELIATLVADLRPQPAPPAVAVSMAVFAAGAALAAMVVTRAGTRVLAADTVSLLVLLAVTGAAAAASLVSAIPGRRRWLAGAGVALAGLAGWNGEIALRAAAVWPAAPLLWGSVPWPKCFVFSLLCGAVPAWILLGRIRRGWSVEPRATAALALAAGTGAGALAVALECPSTAPLHILLGHALPVGLAAVVGSRLPRLVTGRHSAA